MGRALGALLLAAGLLLDGDGTARAASGRIRVAPHATVTGAVLQLGAVAELDGAARELAGVELGDAPAPGASRRLSGHEVLSRLRAAGLDEAIGYSIPASITVSRAFQVLPESELRFAVEDVVARHLPPEERIDGIELVRPVRIAPGPYELEVREPDARASSGALRRVDVRVIQEGREVATVPVRLRVVRFGPVVVTRRAVARGAVLVEDDLGLEERRLDDLPAMVAGSLEDAVGKVARVALGAGRPVPLRALEALPLVQRGDAVRLTIEAGGLRLSAPGEALDTGGAGERVRVVNTSSRRELVGRVVAHGTVLVAY